MVLKHNAFPVPGKAHIQPSYHFKPASKRDKSEELSEKRRTGSLLFHGLDSGGPLDVFSVDGWSWA